MFNPAHGLMNYLRVVLAVVRDDPRADSELLSRFVDVKDEIAFQTMVCRHAKLVWRSCTRVLGNTPDAEDVFQTTFLALARKASGLKRQPLAGWLHQVARRAALNVAAKTRRRESLEQQLRTKTPAMTANTNQTELYAALEEELANLSDQLRIPLIERYLEGKTLEETARLIGCSRRKLGRRLEQGEAILRERLERRGLTLSVVGSVVALLGDMNNVPAVPSDLIENTTLAATAFRAGTLTNGVAEEARELLRALAIEGTVKKLWWMTLTCVGFLGVGGACLAAWKIYESYSVLMVSSTPEANVLKVAAKSHGQRVDNFGDPLPGEALARIGTLRYRSGYIGNDYFPYDDKYCIAFSRDGKVFASINSEHPDRMAPTNRGNREFVHLWETATGKEILRLPGGYIVALSSDGKKLATFSETELVVWDLVSNPPRRMFSHKVKRPGSAIAFSPDDKKLAIGWRETRDEKLLAILLDAATGNVLWEFPMDKRENSVASYEQNLTFSNDGKMLAVGTVVLDVETGKKKLDLNIVPGKVFANLQSMAFSPDHKTLAIATGYDFGKAKDMISLWDTTNGSLKRLFAAGKMIDTLAFLPDGKTLVEMDRKMPSANVGLAHFWDPLTGKEKPPPATLTALSCLPRESRAGHLSPDCKLLVHEHLGAFIVIDTATGWQIGSKEDGMRRIGVIHALAFLSDNKILAVQSTENIYDKSKRERYEAKKRASEFGLWELWEADTGQLWHKSVSTPLRDFLQKNKMAYWNQRLLKPASTDGRWMISGKLQGLDDVILEDQSTHKEVRRFPKPIGEKWLNFTAIASNGQSILTCYNHDESIGSPNRIVHIEIWSVESGEDWSASNARKLVSKEISLPRDAIDCGHKAVAQSPDRRYVAVILGDFVLRLIEVASGTEVAQFEIAKDAAVNILTWSPDGRLLAGANLDGDIYLWDVYAGREVRCLAGGHRAQISVLAFSPDGLRLASGSYDTTALVWDMRNLSHAEAESTKQPSGDDLWTALQKQNAVEAWRAMNLLARNSELALPLLRERLKPIPGPDITQIQALLARLGDNDFQIRSQAEKQLAKMGRVIEPALRNALANNPDLEVRRHLQNILEEISPKEPCILNSVELQNYRGVEVLERIGTDAARQVLQKILKLSPNSDIGTEAKEALNRLEARHVRLAVP